MKVETQKKTYYNMLTSKFASEILKQSNKNGDFQTSLTLNEYYKVFAVLPIVVK